MSYFFRRMFHLVKANPYHDELGRFTTADNAVMFVRPKWGYFDKQNTPDEKWRGAYLEGKRFGIRREPNQQNGAELFAVPSSTKGFLANVAALSPASGPPSSGPGVIAVAQQMAGIGQAIPGAYPRPESVPAAPVKQGPSPQFSSVRTAIERYASTDDSIHEIGDKLRSDGFTVKHNGGGHVNDAVVIKAADGSKFQLKHCTDEYGLGAEGEQIGVQMIRELGINVEVQEALMIRTKGGAEHSLTSWVPGIEPQDTDVDTVRRAIDSTGREEVMKLLMFEALAGDSDKHRANYIIGDNGKVVGMDYSRIGDYESSRGAGHAHQSVLLNSMEGTVSTAGMAEFLKRTYAAVNDKVISRIPLTGSAFRGRTPSDTLEFATSGRAECKAVLDKRYKALLDLMSQGPTVNVEDIRLALNPGGRRHRSYMPGNGW